MKTRPGVFVAAEDAHALHRDLKRLSLWIQSPGIGGPGAPHLVAPNGLLVGEDGVQVIGQKRPLQQITGAWMTAVVLLETGDRPGEKSTCESQQSTALPLASAKTRFLAAAVPTASVASTYRPLAHPSTKAFVSSQP